MYKKILTGILATSFIMTGCSTMSNNYRNSLEKVLEMYKKETNREIPMADLKGRIPMPDLREYKIIRAKKQYCLGKKGKIPVLIRGHGTKEKLVAISVSRIVNGKIQNPYAVRIIKERIVRLNNGIYNNKAEDAFQDGVGYKLKERKVCEDMPGNNPIYPIVIS